MTIFRSQDRTSRLALPYLIPDQAQKHVTINEAFDALDFLSQLTLLSVNQMQPPPLLSDGAAYGLGDAVTGDFLGYQGQVAIWRDGAWSFWEPREGWRAWVVDEQKLKLYRDGQWHDLTASAPDPDAESGSQPQTQFELLKGLKVIRRQHDINLAGANVTRFETSEKIISHELFIGLSARVTQTMSGVTRWSLGDASSPTRFANALAVAAGSSAVGFLSPPQVYWASESFILSSENGVFTGGEIQLVAYSLALALD